MERILTQAQRGDLIGVESYLVAAVQQNHADTPLIVEVLTKAYARASWLMLEEKGARQWTGMIES